MACEEQDTLAAAARGVEILRSVHGNYVFDSLSRVLRELRELAGHPPYLPNHFADHAPPLRIRPFGKCEPEIEHRRAAERLSYCIGSGGKTGPHKSSGRSR